MLLCKAAAALLERLTLTILWLSVHPLWHECIQKCPRQLKCYLSMPQENGQTETPSMHVCHANCCWWVATVANCERQGVFADALEALIGIMPDRKIFGRNKPNVIITDNDLKERASLSQFYNRIKAVFIPV